MSTQKSYIATMRRLDSSKSETRVHVSAETIFDAAEKAQVLASTRMQEVVKIEVLE